MQDPMKLMQGAPPPPGMQVRSAVSDFEIENTICCLSVAPHPPYHSQTSLPR